LLSSALDDALTLAGGSLPIWRVLVSQKDQHPGSHEVRSDAMGLAEATWSEEVERMEMAGLVARKPAPEHLPAPGFELTEAGDSLFGRLLRAVVAFDARLRTGLTLEGRRSVQRLAVDVGANHAGEVKHDHDDNDDTDGDGGEEWAAILHLAPLTDVSTSSGDQPGAERRG
jgi:MarR family transcriptional regulator for hemolysin